MSSSPSPAPPRHPLVLLGRHQVAAVIATGVDFAIMIAAVSLLGLSPVLGTVLGAGSGALTNFLIGRNWAFEARHSPPGGQAARYAVVSASSLGLNASGEWLLTAVVGMQYVIARVIVAAAVSVLWNFPLQRYFVFAPRGAVPSTRP